jgi:macrolide-specific efflux system membrane fusion protein
MRAWKIILAVLLTGTLVFGFLGCTEEEEEVTQQTATASIGDLTVDISAAGNLALSVMEDIAFEMAGTVEDVMVEEGESVTEGEVLARLDTSEWEDEISNLEMAVLEAKINLQNAELNLEEAEDDSDTSATGDVFTTYTDPDEIEILEWRVEKAERTYEDAQEALEEAQAASPEVVAPFDGFITAVKIEGGDEITKGTVAVTIADPDKFEADIYVSELDITDVAIGGSATVEIDALDITIPAEVTYISSSATISSSVVNYTVKVELDSLESVIEAQNAAISEMPSGEMPTGEMPSGERPSGEMPGPMQEAIEGGEMTEEEAAVMQEQMAAMREQMQAAQAAQIAELENVQLREGMTVTVSIVVAERTDAVLVPIGAIMTGGAGNYVQVVADDGTIEDRTVTVGVSNWQYSEITSGLSEGETVVVPEGTATTSSDQMFRIGGGGMMMGGGGPR